MLFGTNNIMWNIPHIQTECEKYERIFYEILSVPHNILMDLNNAMNYFGVFKRKTNV